MSHEASAGDAAALPAVITDLGAELTIQHASANWQRLRDWIDEGARSIDLSAVEQCDSSAVQLLISARRSAEALGQPLQLVRASRAVREVFGRYALTEHLAADTAD